jgi:hypothetical protein
MGCVVNILVPRFVVQVSPAKASWGHLLANKMGAMKRRPKMLQTVTLLTRIAASPPLVTSKVIATTMIRLKCRPRVGHTPPHGSVSN